jgi:lysozyme
MEIPTIPEIAIQLIKAAEGCNLTAYYCPAGILTIGWGSTGRWITPRMKITQEQADNLLYKDTLEAAGAVVRLTSVPITTNQYAALIDFVFNLGAGRYQASTIRSRLNRYEYEGAAEYILKYVYSKGKVLPGLVKRRKIEYQLFMK